MSSSWSKTEDVALFRAIVSVVLSSRPEIYTTPELAAWSGNGGDRINKKTQQLLRKLEATIPGAGDVVSQQVSSSPRPKISKAKSDPDGHDTCTPTTSPSPRKKHKKAVVKDEEDRE